MKTLLGTPEIDRREVYGVIWDVDQDMPHSVFDSLEEAKQTAEVLGGYIVSCPMAPSDWAPVSPALLE